MKFTLPNIFSLSRVVLSPIIIIFLLSGNSTLIQLSFFIFLGAALTDYFDGWYARKYLEVTNMGKFLDPLADKVLTSSAFISFVCMNIIPLWMVIIVMIRDIWTTLIRVYVPKSKHTIKTSIYAKGKTFFQMVFIIYILLLLFLINTGFFSISTKELMNKLIYSELTYWIMFFITILSIITAFEYFFQRKGKKNINN
ncbi:MAG TPA: CDP-diacylglycerol--glycerol-3-phosphate 3-phosphatidyltransferase [Candidatus Kapabacteria bacterium]|nr:CDP-diacylglycerol--glycerol-3-phosphate 3-phosphatidyltransferase [Candidatus Kapabacteria bacterium]HPO62631.1 CDP-diacylglycerol--glycerol-3-phosphate 3-phosphatidyltransferase [Candidatus Kapabacteria bacterium]